MNDKKFVKAAMVVDGALAGITAFYSITAALLMMALLVFIAIRL